MISYFIFWFFKVLYLILLFYCICSWIPQVNWYKEPFATVRTISDLVFTPFRRIIPTIGMLDISPIVAFIALNFLEALILKLLGRIGI